MLKRLLAAAVLLSILAGSGAAGSAAWAAETPTDAWPVPRGNAEASGATTVQLPEELVEQWSFTAEDAIEAPAVISAQGRVYVADGAGALYALDLRDGSQLWKQETPLGFLAGPAVDDGRVVIGDLDGTVFAFDADSGEPLWTFSTGAEIDAGASFYQDLVLVTSHDGNLYALNAESGEEVWKYETSDQVRCSPTVVGDRTFLGGCDGLLHLIDLKTGQAAAEPLPLESPTASTPAVLGGRAFLPNYSGQVFGFDWRAPQRLWKYEDPERPQEYRSSAAVSSRAVVLSSQARTVVALDPETGEELWRQTIRRRSDASPVIAGDDVWLASTDGRLVRLSIADGSERWHYEIRGRFLTSPAIVEGRLVIGDDQGVVRCFGAAAVAP